MGPLIPLYWTSDVSSDLTLNGVVNYFQTQVWLYNNSLTTLDAGSFSGLPRPLAISLGANDLQCDSDLCWLKQGYVTWLSFENRRLLPDCSGSVTWNDLYCPVQGKNCFRIENLSTIRPSSRANPGFPKRGANPKRGERQLVIWSNFPENCKKM